MEKIRSKLLVSLGTLVTIIIVLLGLVHYKSVEQSLMRDIREHQLVTILKASQSSLQAILEKAIETSEILSEDPALQLWFREHGKDAYLQQMALQEIDGLWSEFDYQTVFAVNAKSLLYWQENYRCLDTLSQDDPDDSWFFSTISQPVRTTLNFDFNRELNQTILFVNVLMGDMNEPLGIAGVGIDPSLLNQEFHKHKPSKNSRLWLVDAAGMICYSEEGEEINHNLSQILSSELVQAMVRDDSVRVFSNQLFNLQEVEVVKMNVGNTGYKVVMVAPINELLEVLNEIRRYTIGLSLLMMFITFLVITLLARHLSRPLVRLTELSREFSKGHFNQDMDSVLLARHDEIGKLAVAFHAMQKQLAQVINNLNQANADLEKEQLELKRTNSELEKALVKAAESDRLTKAFLANISHEIRTPMNSIMGFSQILELGDLDAADQQHYTGLIVASGQQLINIINSIVDISKVDAEFVKPQKQKVNIGSLITDTLKQFQTQAQQAGLKLASHLPEDNPSCVVETDPVMVKQVLDILVSNAIKYTPSGSVLIGFKRISPAVEIFVADSGMGIPQQSRELIFEPFFQLSTTDAVYSGGAGLGLALARKLVHSLGGEISLKSAPHQGSIFYFSLPVAEVNRSI